jgi:hypothetical protein
LQNKIEKFFSGCVIGSFSRRVPPYGISSFISNTDLLLESIEVHIDLQAEIFTLESGYTFATYKTEFLT